MTYTVVNYRAVIVIYPRMLVITLRTNKILPKPLNNNLKPPNPKDRTPNLPNNNTSTVHQILAAEEKRAYRPTLVPVHPGRLPNGAG